MVTILVSGSMVMFRTLPRTRSISPDSLLMVSTRMGSPLLSLTLPSVITAGTTFRKISPCAVTLITAVLPLQLIIQTFTGSNLVPMEPALMIFSTFAQMGALVLPELVLDTSFTAVSAPPVSPVHWIVRVPSYRDRKLFTCTSPVPLVVMVKVAGP